MNLIPYVQVDGRWSLTDTCMKALFEKMREHDLIKVVFSSGTVGSAEDFLGLAKNPMNTVHTVWNDNGICLAVIWLNNYGFNHAFGHFCIYPEAWGKHTDEIGKLTLDYWFGFEKEDGSPMLDVILGKISAENQHALSFLQRIGMKVVGVIPKIMFDFYENRKVGAAFLYIEREVLEDG